MVHRHQQPINRNGDSFEYLQNSTFYVDFVENLSDNYM